jgi:uncharacterized protein (DUF849 family)
MTSSNQSVPHLQAAINGARDDPLVPRTPAELAGEARAAVDAGADSIHLHAYEDGAETLDPDPCADALRAVRDVCPDTSVTMTSSAVIEPDPDRRIERIAAWTEAPDLVSVNVFDPGFVDLCEVLLDHDIGIEAAIWSEDHVETLVETGLDSACERILVEAILTDPSESLAEGEFLTDPDEAVAQAESMEQTLEDAHIGVEQVHHGWGTATWAVGQRALDRGHGFRTGLEDTTVLPNGDRTTGNGELIAAARELHG